MVAIQVMGNTQRWAIPAASQGNSRITFSSPVAHNLLRSSPPCLRGASGFGRFLH